MSEAEFWVTLEYRLCDELAGMPERGLPYLWCDGFIPDRYLLDENPPRVTGKVWICNGRRQAEWDFVTQDAALERQRSFALDAAAEIGSVAVRDGQPGDRDAGACEDVKDALRVVATDHRGAGARPLDGKVLGKIELPARQGDGAAQGRIEEDGVPTGRGGDLGAERTRTAIDQVRDREGTEQHAVFERLDSQLRAPGTKPGTPAARAFPIGSPGQGKEQRHPERLRRLEGIPGPGKPSLALAHRDHEKLGERRR